MEPHQSIPEKKQPATEGAVCRTESKNHPAHGRACDDEYIDKVHHHNERGKKTQAEPDFDAEGIIPSN